MSAAIIKTVQTQVLASPETDPTTATVNYDRWLFIETYLVIITASIPCIRSLTRSTRGRSVSSRHTHELSSRDAASAKRNTRTRRDSSSDRKRIINVSAGNASNDEMHESETRESAMHRV